MTYRTKTAGVMRTNTCNLGRDSVNTLDRPNIHNHKDRIRMRQNIKYRHHVSASDERYCARDMTFLYFQKVTDFEIVELFRGHLV